MARRASAHAVLLSEKTSTHAHGSSPCDCWRRLECGSAARARAAGGEASTPGVRVAWARGDCFRGAFTAHDAGDRGLDRGGRRRSDAPQRVLGLVGLPSRCTPPPDHRACGQGKGHGRRRGVQSARMPHARVAGPDRRKRWTLWSHRSRSGRAIWGAPAICGSANTIKGAWWYRYRCALLLLCVLAMPPVQGRGCGRIAGAHSRHNASPAVSSSERVQQAGETAVASFGASVGASATATRAASWALRPRAIQAPVETGWQSLGAPPA